MQRLGMQNMQNMGGPNRKRRLSYLVSEGATLGPDIAWDGAENINGTGVTFTPPSVQFTNATAGDAIYSGPLTAGKRYQTSIVVNSISGTGGVRLRLNIVPGNWTPEYTAVGTYLYDLTAVDIYWVLNAPATLVANVTLGIREIIPVWING